MTIYPAIDIRDGRCVRLRQGLAAESTAYFDDPADPANAFAAAGAAWVHVVDLDGAFGGKPRNLDALRRIAALVHAVQFGGGLRTAADVDSALDAGAHRVVIGTKAAADKAFAAEMLRRYGEKIAVGIDARDGFVAVKGWVELTALRAWDFAVQMVDLGARTLIYTDIATDGMLSGPNFDALERMLAVPGANVIASGGVSRREDVVRLRQLACKYTNLDGVIVGRAIYEKRVSLADLIDIATAPLPFRP
ncbi:MAG: 1-(5-phosphoribosyl)-5-[(5-phosphoribosylamino)methylideneamino]imidazole-4-carboxamide isomerase [Puniceicoccales bacterium]|jgi:phosphoribosylformimino-5-aminoimidazole carboxamide ribotide isomerase|nr:1-(5-phosphoribosyl)-5-[(5-phosphoribosylamino)methylideneamino]imidazole-4-carboxamide isomerase [Puniceicoccales bacterium]